MSIATNHWISTIIIIIAFSIAIIALESVFIVAVPSVTLRYKIATLGPSFHSGPSSLSCFSIDIYLSFQDYSISTISIVITIIATLESVFIVAGPRYTPV